MANMTDQGRTSALLNFIFNAGSALTITTPYHLRLMSAMGSGNGNTSGANGTELSSGNAPGYTPGSVVSNSMGSPPTFASFSAGQSTGNTNAVTWTATGTWTAGVLGIEIWDAAGTPLRWLQGTLSTAIGANVVVSGDTVSFAASSITVNASAW